MLELTFSVGENRTRMTKRRLSSPSMYNELMKFVKSTREFSRRSREMDFAVLKAQEMRNIILFYFVIIIQCIEPEAKERRLWFLLTFIFRACVIPECEYAHINQNEIKNAAKQFYVLYQQLFTTKNCTYSIHVFISHLLKIRSLGPLTEFSAFPFENFYGELRKAFVPGTVSGLKQIMQKVYLKRSVSYHCCKKTIYYSPKDTALEMNSIIYIFSNGNYNMYKIFKIEPDNVFHCYVQGKIEIEFDEATDLSWSKIGVFREGATGSEEIIIQKNDVHGKVLNVSDLLVTCPLNVLREI